MTRVFYDEDVPPEGLAGETVAVLGYGIQGRAQAHNLRDAGVAVVVGNRDDDFRRQAAEDGFPVLELTEAAARATLVVMLVPDELQPEIYRDHVAAALGPGDGLVFAHGYAVRSGLVAVPQQVDLMLCAPRMPGQYVRGRYLEGWGVPAFVGVERDATGRAWSRLLGLAGALGFTRCAAIETSFAQETELDHFSEHFTYPLIFRALELAGEPRLTGLQGRHRLALAVGARGSPRAVGPDPGGNSQRRLCELPAGASGRGISASLRVARHPFQGPVAGRRTSAEMASTEGVVVVLRETRTIRICPGGLCSTF